MLRCRRYVTSALGAAALVVSLGQAGATADPHPTSTTGAAPGTYQTVTQARVLDTRSGVGAARGQVAAGGSVTIAVAGHDGVADSVAAVALTVTATHPTRAGYVTAFAAGATRPGTSVLNFTAGATVAGLALVPVSPTGAVTLFNGSSGPIDLVADISGYVVGGVASAAGTISPVTPSRVLDTRFGVGVRRARVPGHGSVVVDVAGHAGVPANGAAAAAVVITAVAPSAGGYLTVTPASAGVGATSTLNFAAGQTVANSTVAALDASGRLRITNGSAGPVDVLADVSAYARGGSTTADGTYAALGDPTRLLDTRSGVGAAPHPVAAAGTVSLRAVGAGGIPSQGVSVVALNVTVTNASSAGYLTTWPGQTPRPSTSVANFAAKQVVADLVLAPVGADGQVQIYNGSLHPVDVVADVVGYVRGAPAADTVAPEPVSGLTVTPSSVSAALRWTNPAGHDATSIVIRRATGSTPPVDAASGDAVTTLTPPAASYTDSDLPPNATYSYSVFSRDAAGNLSPARSATVALTPSQQITGTVRSAGGTPQAGVAVTAQDATTGDELSAKTGPDGSYRLTGVQADTDYGVCFDPSGVPDQPTGGYERQCWPNRPGTDGGDNVFVPEAGTRAGVDATLALGGTVTGTVTDGSGTPLAGVGVALDDTDHPALTHTAVDGTYRLSGVVPSRAAVCFLGAGAVDAAAPVGHLNSCYGTDYSDESITGSAAVPVTAGGMTPLIDVSLRIRRSIAGSVSDAGGLPLSGVQVETDGSSVTTAADGTYRLPLPTQFNGDEVCFIPPTPTPYSEQCHQLVNSEEAPDGSYPHLDLRFGTPTASKTVVTGTVLDPAGHPLSHVLVTIPDYTPEFAQPTAYTSTSGTFRLTGAQVGVGFSVCFGANSGVRPAAAYGYIDQCITLGQDANGAPVTTGLVGHLLLGGAISGTVRDTSGAPLPGLTVSIGHTNGPATAGGFAVTDKNGRWELSDQPESPYYVVDFAANGTTRGVPVYTGGSSTTGYLDQCWKAVKPYGECTLVTVTAGTLTPGIDATVEAAGGAGGQVTDPDGTPLRHVTVYAGGPGAVQSTTTDGQGRWRITGLTPGASAVCVDGRILTSPSPAGYQFTCYDGIRFGDDDHYPVPVTSGETTTGLDIVLQPNPYGAISGTITTSAGKVVAGATVNTEATGSTTTDASGHYILPVAPIGSYPLCVDPSTATNAGTTGLLRQCFGGTPGGSTSTSITVTAGGDAKADLTLHAGGAVAGTVRDQFGTPLADVDVQIYDSVGSYLPDVHTDKAGNYRIVGLVARTYVLYFGPTAYTTSADSGYSSESRWSGGALDQQSATGFSVHTGSTTTEDASLPLDGAVTGNIVDETGAGVQGAQVSAQDASGNRVSATTRADGTYTIAGVPAGPLVVCALGPGNSVSPFGTTSTCVGGDESGAPTGSLTVAAGATHLGVDLTLTRYAEITVQVTNSHLDALTNLTVDVTDSTGSSIGAQCYTRDDGVCRVDDLLPGTYGLLVHGPAGDQTVPPRSVPGGRSVDYGRVVVPTG